LHASNAAVQDSDLACSVTYWILSYTYYPSIDALRSGDPLISFRLAVANHAWQMLAEQECNLLPSVPYAVRLAAKGQVLVRNLDPPTSLFGIEGFPFFQWDVKVSTKPSQSGPKLARDDQVHKFYTQIMYYGPQGKVSKGAASEHIIDRQPPLTLYVSCKKPNADEFQGC
jgi:hypothetical protein